MGTVQVTKDWIGGITPNKRRTYTSLNDLAGWFIFENTQRLSAKWTRVWESDGVTGPANAADHTQRLTSVAACSVRGSAAGNAQSFGVYQASDGAQLSFAYQGAFDDFVRIGYSRAGVYTLAGTTTNQPTAADELVISAGNSIVGGITSLDRVMSIWCIDGDWRCAIFRSNAISNVLGLAQVTPLVSTRAVNPIFTPPYVAWRYTNAVRSSGVQTPVGGITNVAIGAAGFLGTMARVYTDSLRNIRVGGGDIGTAGASNGSSTVAATWSTDKPALQNGEGSPLLPIYWSGEKAANNDGFLGSPIDWWSCYTANVNVPAAGDPFTAWTRAVPGFVSALEANWLVAIGSAIVWPWLNAAPNMETA